jgi:Zn finger protein HypA/HybF involved in hydrogenase expression
MHEHGLARDLWPQLKQIADARGMARVRRLEMIVGMLHGVSSELLVHSFAHAFEGSIFEGAEVLITIVEPGQEYMPPNASGPSTAHGWELLVVRMEEGQE